MDAMLRLLRSQFPFRTVHTEGSEGGCSVTPRSVKVRPVREVDHSLYFSLPMYDLQKIMQREPQSVNYRTICSLYLVQFTAKMLPCGVKGIKNSRNKVRAYYSLAGEGVLLENVVQNNYSTTFSRAV